MFHANLYFKYEAQEKSCLKEATALRIELENSGIILDTEGDLIKISCSSEISDEYLSKIIQIAFILGKATAFEKLRADLLKIGKGIE